MRKKEIESMVHRYQNEAQSKKKKFKSPYLSYMDTIPFPPKFKQPVLQSYDGNSPPQQHICHFKALTWRISDNDALLIHLFASPIKQGAFDWFSLLPEGSITSWTVLEEKILNYFFDDEEEITPMTLMLTKQEPKEVVRDFIKR